MEKVREIAKQLNVIPKLRLGNKLPGGGVEATGPHRVKFLKEPVVIMGKDDKGVARKELKFEVAESKSTEEAQYDGQHPMRWQTPILSKEGQPSYIIEKLMDVEVGDERILEMRKQGGGRGNYIDVRKVDAEPEEPEHEEAAEFAEALRKEGHGK